MDYACPNCGAPLIFKSSVSIYTTCTNCRSTIVRHDMDLERLGEVSELLDDMAPLQVWTTGRFEDKPFTLLGRIKIIYDGGTWSEWYALFDDGRQAWLSSAQGQYMMSFETEIPDILKSSKLSVGKSYKIGERDFIMDDIRKVSYAASEGELPFLFEQGYKATSADLRTEEDGMFANVLYGPEGPQLFLGKYMSFDTFNFQNLRTIDGWKRA